MLLHLQQRHRIIWRLLAILLPIGFIAAYYAIPTTAINERQAANAPLFPTLEQTIHNDFGKVAIHSIALEDTLGNAFSNYQIVIQLNEVITTPNATLYLSDNEKIENAIVVGNIQSKKAYRFETPTNPKGKNLIFYDGIHQKTLKILALNNSH